MNSFLGLANLVAAIVVVWLFHVRDAGRRPARVLSDGRIEFTPDSLTFPALLLLEVPVIWYCIRTLQHGIAFGWSLLPVAPTVIVGWTALVHLVSFPGTVVVTRDELEHLYWFLPNKQLRWTDIREIRSVGDLKITGSDGTVIVHSMELADRERRMSEIRRYCASELAPDFPQEPEDGEGATNRRAE